MNVFYAAIILFCIRALLFNFAVSDSFKLIRIPIIGIYMYIYTLSSVCFKIFHMYIRVGKGNLVLKLFVSNAPFTRWVMKLKATLSSSRLVLDINENNVFPRLEIELTIVASETALCWCTLNRFNS